MSRTRLYRNGVLEADGFPIADVSEHIADPSATVWLDLCGPTADDFAAISEELGLHSLAVEDAVHEHQRPKLDHYDNHLFLNAYAVGMTADAGQLATCEVAAFFTASVLVTVRKDERFDIDAVVASWDA
jgi:magnesium transporter